MASTFKVILLVFCTLSLTGVSSASMYDAAADFSLSSNPNGNWTYGTSGTTLGGTISAYSTATANFQPNFDIWNNGVLNPSVFKNTSGATNTYSSLTLFANELALHPGASGEYSVVEFTADHSGNYTYAGAFSGRDNTTTDVHVYLNGSSQFSALVTGYLDTQSFSSSVFLNTGDKLDFVVGFGIIPNYAADTTALSVQISDASAPVPEPATLAIWGGLGLVGLVAARRRKQTA